MKHLQVLKPGQRREVADLRLVHVERFETLEFGKGDQVTDVSAPDVEDSQAIESDKRHEFADLAAVKANGLKLCEPGNRRHIADRAKVELKDFQARESPDASATSVKDSFKAPATRRTLGPRRFPSAERNQDGLSPP